LADVVPGESLQSRRGFFSSDYFHKKSFIFERFFLSSIFLHNFGNPNRQRTLHKNLSFFQNKRRGFQKIMSENRSADSGFGESPAAGSLLEVFLEPQQRLLQPVKVDIAAEACVLDEQQSDKNRRPFPAQFPFLAAFDQPQRGNRVSGHGERQSPQHQPPGLGSRGNLPIPKLLPGNRRDAEEDDRQQNTVDALDQESLHEPSLAGACRPVFMFDRLIDFLRNLAAEHPLLHPAHRQQIIKRCEQAVPHTVVAPAGMAVVGRNRDLGDGETLDLEQGRHEAVHSLEKFQVRDALTFKRPVAATGVTDVFIR